MAGSMGGRTGKLDRLARIASSGSIDLPPQNSKIETNCRVYNLVFWTACWRARRWPMQVTVLRVLFLRSISELNEIRFIVIRLHP